MMQQHRPQSKSSVMLCIILFLINNISNNKFVYARLGGDSSNDNIFSTGESDDDTTLSGDFIVLIAEQQQQEGTTLSAMSSTTQDVVSSLANDLTDRYALIKKNTFSDGFTASNLTKKDLANLQKEDQILLVEKDGIISIEDIELDNNDEDDFQLITGNENRTKNSNETTMDMNMQLSIQAQSEFIPEGVSQIGWRNVEYDQTIMSRRVFIIDSGLSDPSDEFNIDTNMARNFVSNENSNDWSDCSGHGTHIAGTLAARENGRGVVGVAAGAVIVPIRVLDCTANGQISDIVRAINYVAGLAYPGDVVNLSLGGPVEQRSIDIALENAARRTGAYFVVAAGNGSTDAREYSPARVNMSNVYTVCALDGDMKTVASFSNFGKPPIDVCAPGTGIVSLSRYGGTTTKSGTSMAAPHVAGVLLFGSMKTISGGAKSNRDGKKYKVVQRPNTYNS